jgi:hypothetical protein
MPEKTTLEYETPDHKTHKPAVSWRLISFGVMCGLFSSIGLDMALPAWNIQTLRFIFVLFVAQTTMVGVVYTLHRHWR